MSVPHQTGFTLEIITHIQIKYKQGSYLLITDKFSWFVFIQFEGISYLFRFFFFRVSPYCIALLLVDSVCFLNRLWNTYTILMCYLSLFLFKFVNYYFLLFYFIWYPPGKGWFITKTIFHCIFCYFDRVRLFHILQLDPCL